MTELSSRPWRLPLRRVNRESAPWAYRWVVFPLAHPLLGLVGRRDWRGQEHLPQQGGVLVVANHLSNIDPLFVGEYLIFAGRWPRFLGKAEIWKWPVLGWVARATHQIPVYRGSERATDALMHAREALNRGQTVVIYPEGTITEDPGLWPMSGRRGAAQLALLDGINVVPLAQWGAHELLGARKIDWRRLFSGRKDVRIQAGPPVDLDDFRSRVPLDGEAPKEVLEEMTAHLLDVVTAMLSELRGEDPPAGRWDMRLGDRVTKLSG